MDNLEQTITDNKGGQSCLSLKENLCPALIRLINENTEGNPDQIRRFIKKGLTGCKSPKTILEIRGLHDTGKSLFRDLLIQIIGKNNTTEFLIDNLKKGNTFFLKDKKLGVINDSIFDLTKKQINILYDVITNEDISCLFIKIAELYPGHNLKPLPLELATPLIFKRSLSNNYLSELKYISEFELDGIRKWALGD